MPRESRATKDIFRNLSHGDGMWELVGEKFIMTSVEAFRKDARSYLGDQTELRSSTLDSPDVDWYSIWRYFKTGVPLADDGPWSRYLPCETCGAEYERPCLSMKSSGRRPIAQPHDGRHFVGQYVSGSTVDTDAPAHADTATTEPAPANPAVVEHAEPATITRTRKPPAGWDRSAHRTPWYVLADGEYVGYADRTSADGWTWFTAHTMDGTPVANTRRKPGQDEWRFSHLAGAEMALAGRTATGTAQPATRPGHADTATLTGHADNGHEVDATDDTATRAAIGRAHRADTVEAPLAGFPAMLWRSACTCRWVSDRYDDKRTAGRAHDRHVMDVLTAAGSVAEPVAKSSGKIATGSAKRPAKMPADQRKYRHNVDHARTLPETRFTRSTIYA
jgi:hypothetical protein